MHPARETKRITILLYIKHPEIAARLTDLLSSHDMAVTTAFTTPELQDAARIGGLDVATTNTAGIETIRQMTSLPVVNIDAFIFSRAMQPGETKGSSKFDTAAFIKRLVDVTSPRMPRLPDPDGRDREASINPAQPAW